MYEMFIVVNICELNFCSGPAHKNILALNISKNYGIHVCITCIAEGEQKYIATFCCPQLRVYRKARNFRVYKISDL